MTPEAEHDHGPKYVQHDYDPAADSGDRIVDERPLEDIFAEAMTPEDYVLSSPEAMAAAVEQAARQVGDL